MDRLRLLWPSLASGAGLVRLAPVLRRPVAIHRRRLVLRLAGALGLGDLSLRTLDLRAGGGLALGAGLGVGAGVGLLALRPRLHRVVRARAGHERLDGPAALHR